MKRWPALDIRVGAGAGALAGREAQADRAGLFAAWLDDFSPTAITELDAPGDDALAWRVFFASDEARTIAAHALAAAPAWTGATASSIDVDDEAWAERSQASLTAIRVGRVIVTPPWDVDGAAALARQAAAERTRSAHHRDRTVDGLRHGPPRIDAAVPARRCSGRRSPAAPSSTSAPDPASSRLRPRGSAPRTSVGLDDDRDALDSATANVALNALPAGRVEMRQGNLLAEALPVADVVLGNLTGALLRRAAATLEHRGRPRRRA